MHRAYAIGRMQYAHTTCVFERMQGGVCNTPILQAPVESVSLAYAIGRMQ